MFAPLAFVAGVFLIDKDAAHTDIFEAEQHMRLGRCAVAAGAANFLIIGFETAGQVGVKDKPHIGFVDTMPKAMVATITMAGSVIKRFWLASRASLSMPA